MKTEEKLSKLSFYLPPRVKELAKQILRDPFVMNNELSRSIIWQTLDIMLKSNGIKLPYFQLKELGDLIYEVLEEDKKLAI